MIKTSSAKAKGRKLQQWVAKTISEVFNLEVGDVESRPMGSGGVDLMMSPEARKRFPVSVECKSQMKTPSLMEIRQSEANAYLDTIPIVVWKPKGANHEDSLVMMKFKDFAKWYKENT